MPDEIEDGMDVKSNKLVKKKKNKKMGADWRELVGLNREKNRNSEINNLYLFMT